MGSIAGTLGLAGGVNGTGMAAPTNANVQQGTNIQQTGQAYGQNQYALQQQQNLLNALSQQNGMGNQNAAYNNLGNVASQIGGVAGQMGGAYGQNQALYNQLQGIAAGQGPNPAQAMLNQQTSANVANQAALMAGQRGAGANAGLMARQAAQQGAATQQQAVGQGATMQANQSLQALGQAGGVLGQGANILGQQGNLLGAQAGVVGQQGNIAANQVANQIGATGAVTDANQAEQANLLNALGGYNNAQVSSQSSVNAGNTALAQTQMQGQQAVMGGLMNAMGGGAVSGMMGGAHGGVVKKPTQKAGAGGLMSLIPLVAMLNKGGSVGMADGGAVMPQSSFGRFLAGVSAPGQIQTTPIPSAGPNYGAQALEKGTSKMLTLSNKTPAQAAGVPSAGGVQGGGSADGGFNSPGGTSMMAGGPGDAGGGAADASSGIGSMAGDAAVLASKGGMVDVALSPGEKVVPPGKVGEAAGGKVEAKTVPGKAKYAGDTTKNDTYKTKLREGSIVIPRTKSKDPRDSAAFVRSTLAKRRKK